MTDLKTPPNHEWSSFIFWQRLTITQFLPFFLSLIHLSINLYMPIVHKLYLIAFINLFPNVFRHEDYFVTNFDPTSRLTLIVSWNVCWCNVVSILAIKQDPVRNPIVVTTVDAVCRTSWVVSCIIVRPSAVTRSLITVSQTLILTHAANASTDVATSMQSTFTNTVCIYLSSRCCSSWRCCTFINVCFR